MAEHHLNLGSTSGGNCLGALLCGRRLQRLLVASKCLFVCVLLQLSIRKELPGERLGGEERGSSKAVLRRSPPSAVKEGCAHLMQYLAVSEVEAHSLFNCLLRLGNALASCTEQRELGPDGRLPVVAHIRLAQALLRLIMSPEDKTCGASA
eukprot:scaffold297291_cov32-Tisochrysis_lutea.AAC.3